jgi:hypothetical protein
VLEDGQKPRLLLRIANWLHLNRGKKAWTYFADGYAAFLLILATTGLFMLPGRKGLIGRGGILVASASPSRSSTSPSRAAPKTRIGRPSRDRLVEPLVQERQRPLERLLGRVALLADQVDRQHAVRASS